MREMNRTIEGMQAAATAIQSAMQVMSVAEATMTR